MAHVTLSRCQYCSTTWRRRRRRLRVAARRRLGGTVAGIGAAAPSHVRGPSSVVARRGLWGRGTAAGAFLHAHLVVLGFGGLAVRC